MDEDRTRWDERYGAEELLLGSGPSRLLADWLDRLLVLCPGRRALDIACGEGRNSIFLARHGFAVTGLDISPVGIAKAAAWAAREGLTGDFRVTELEGFRITERFDLILNFNFLLRELIPGMVAALNPGGVILFDTILAASSAPIPHRQEYLLQPGELAALFGSYPGAILSSAEFPDDANPTAKLVFRSARDE